MSMRNCTPAPRSCSGTIAGDFGAERGSVTRSMPPARPASEPTSASPRSRRAAVHKAAVRCLSCNGAHLHRLHIHANLFQPVDCGLHIIAHAFELQANNADFI